MLQIFPEEKANKRFNSKIVDNGDLCWKWLASTNSNGYPHFLYRNRLWGVSRLIVFGLEKNPLIVRHICDNKGCVNPKHLLSGTYSQNRLDYLKRNPNACFFSRFPECYAYHDDKA